MGYHGASLETLDHLIKFGRLPGRKESNNNKNLPQQGDLYFMPPDVEVSDRYSKFAYVKEQVEKRYKGIPKHLWEVSDYAETNAFEDYLAIKLGLEVRSFKTMEIVDYITLEYSSDNMPTEPSEMEIFREINNIINNLSLTDNELVELLNEAKRRKGVIFSFSKEIQNDFQVSKGDDGQDLRIHTGTGLPISYINGILPLGSMEEEFLEDLKRKYHLNKA